MARLTASINEPAPEPNSHIRANASRGDLLVANNDALETIKLNTAANTGAAIESAIFPGLNFIMRHPSLQNRVIPALSWRDRVRLLRNHEA